MSSSSSSSKSVFITINISMGPVYNKLQSSNGIGQKKCSAYITMFVSTINIIDLVILTMTYCYANDEREDWFTMKNGSKSFELLASTFLSKDIRQRNKNLHKDKKTTRKQQEQNNRTTDYMYNIITYLGSMKRNFPSKLCRDANWFSFNSHSTALVKLGRARTPTPTRYRGSTVFPRELSEAMLFSLESCVTV